MRKHQQNNYIDTNDSIANISADTGGPKRIGSVLISEIEIANKESAEKYRQQRYQSEKSTQNIIRMKDGM